MDKEILRSLARSTLGPVAEILVTLGYALRPRLSTDHPLQSGAEQNTDFPIDLVYTWVDGSDPSWQADKQRYQQDLDENPLASRRSAHPSCYKSRDELLYSLRSVALYAAFVNRIHIVTAGQVPAWLNTGHPGIQLVSHRDIFSDRETLPTFNANAIESRLHHIPGLSEHFLYLNDDMFFGRRAGVHDYFERDGRPVFYHSKLDIPDTPPLQTDTGYEWGIKNSRDLLQGDFEVPRMKKLLHAPYVLRKSILEELETTYAASLRTTAGNRFRQMTDVGLVYSLFPYYAAIKGQGSLKDPRASGYNNAYLNIGSPFLKAGLKKLLLGRSCHTFCINESISTGLDTAAIDAAVTAFLQAVTTRSSC